MISNLKKYISLHILSIITVIVFVGIIIAEITLPSYFIKNGGPFDPIADTYPGLMEYENIIFAVLIIYLILDIILIFSAIIEFFVHKKTNKYFSLMTNNFIINNRFYGFVFGFGIFLASAPIWGSALGLVILFISELLPP